MNYSLHGEPIDWAVPVLYARDPNMTLVRRRRPRDGCVRRRDGAHRARRATRSTRSRVAVWDMDDVFPALERTLDAMNDAQTDVRLRARRHVGAARCVGPRPTEGTDFLWAERVARRLQSKAAELGADLLACVTRHWLRDNDWLYLYGWWPDGGKPPVMIFSIAGFDDLEPEGPETDRAIANAMVSGLAGFFGDIGTHSKARGTVRWLSTESAPTTPRRSAEVRRRLPQKIKE